MRVFFLTRSLYPYQKTGGSQIRLGQVEALKNLGWDIIIITPNYDNNVIDIIDNVIRIPFSRNKKLASMLERTGVYEDYLDPWVDYAFRYLKAKINKEDVIFATSGGELGMIKVGSLLKAKIGCRFLVNYHDPLDYSLVHSVKINRKFHVSREKIEYKYLLNSDVIFTSSKSNKNSLQAKHPEFTDKIFNNYFGYISKIDLSPYFEAGKVKIRIAYVGNMSATQKPEVLYKAYKNLKNRENVELYFIGDREDYTPLLSIVDPNIKFMKFLPHKEFLKFMSENIDIGFVSLANDYFGACVPSKIYEYINLELPIIGALPDGDGVDLINNNMYGMACKYDDINSLSNIITKFSDRSFLKKIKTNIVNDKYKWSMEYRINEVDLIMKKLLSGN